MQISNPSTSEVAILNRVLEPHKPMLSVQAARDILALDFGPADQERMRQLSAKARAETLAPDEQVEINNYERVGHLLNIMQSKASRSLKGPPYNLCLACFACNHHKGPCIAFLDTPE